ncbi:tail fiber protein [Bradyrhizobium guangzhouense]|uniref:tail fiber protein n=1 Tax=Bradyrhizobium guangzhouense TaxID=1325095 RepID=UPI0013E8B1FB|nr:tail fiber protein [Bradyrhizobium guangzhouense]
MTADTYSSNLGLLLMGTGNNNNTWGTNANNFVFAPTDRAIAGANIQSSTGGTIDLSGTVPPAGLRQDIDHIQYFTGTLVSDLTVIVPNISKTWWFANITSGSQSMFVKVPGGTSGGGGLIQIPQGTAILVMCNGAGTLFRQDRANVGNIVHHAGQNVPAGTLACNGASLLRAEYPDLFNAIGTTWGSADSLHFAVPDLTDTARYLRSSSGSLSVGTYQSNQNASHTHTASSSSVTGATDSQGSHTHSATSTDSGHSHALPVQGFANNGSGVTTTVSQGSNNGGQLNSANSLSATAVISTTINSAGTHTHSVSGIAGAQIIASQGGSEARPESAVVLFGIRY